MKKKEEEKKKRDSKTSEIASSSVHGSTSSRSPLVVTAPAHEKARARTQGFPVIFGPLSVHRLK